MLKFLNWVGDTYGDVARFAVLFALVFIGVVVLVVLIGLTYGGVLLLCPIALAALFVKFRREQGR